jgi:hypothetical protein
LSPDAIWIAVSTHALQMKTLGPQISLRTARRRWSQKLQWKSSNRSSCLPNDLAFSGESPPERSEEGGSSAAMPVWVDCSILDSPGQLGMIEAGHAPAGYEPATRNA